MSLKLVAVLLLACVASTAAVDTVSELDLNLYLGRWYQVYADLTVMMTFERNAVCVTADCKSHFSRT